MKIKLKVCNFAFICNGDHRNAHCLKILVSWEQCRKKSLLFHSYMCSQVAVFSKQQINSPIYFCADAVVSYCNTDAQLITCGICCSNVCFLWHLWNGLYIKKRVVHDKNDRNIHFFLSKWLTSKTKSTQWPSMLESPMWYRKLAFFIEFCINWI